MGTTQGQICMEGIFPATACMGMAQEQTRREAIRFHKKERMDKVWP